VIPAFRNPHQAPHEVLSELIEAHVDTIQMIVSGDADAWEEHLRYLHGLVRHAKGHLARQPPDSTRAAG
jgi:hypothetical protein